MNLNKPKTKKQKLITKKPITRDGFTLVEMLVSLSIISFVFLATTGIYSYSVRSQTKSAKLSSLQQEGNYILSVITKDIRNGMVNYAYYGALIPWPASTLALINYNTNQTIVYSLSSGIIMKNINEAGNQPVTASDVEVTTLQFYISPDTNPFVNSSGTAHPRVTIVLELKAKDDFFRLQQTVIQRYGERK